ncbi:MAG TPA: hypothetical protein VKM93_22535 [Terriglobia bacterium]|nr:hypothetical protein [Terriglobia bacterium]
MPTSGHPTVEGWLRDGKTVELGERDRFMAHIVPEPAPAPPPTYPDFAAMRREIFGAAFFPAQIC